MTLAIFLQFTVEVGDIVCAKCDARHEGKVKDLLNGIAMVQFGWRGHIALFHVADLNVVKKRSTL